jgi:hypothetical protein
MDDHRHTDLRELRKRVKTAEYRVDSGAVADALVRRRWVVAVAPGRAPADSGRATVAQIASRRGPRARVTCVDPGLPRGRTEALAA